MPDQIVLESLIRESDVIEDGDYSYMDLRMPVSIVFEKTIPLYYLYDTNGCVIEKIEVGEMPKKWREFFEDDAS